MGFSKSLWIEGPRWSKNPEKNPAREINLRTFFYKKNHQNRITEIFGPIWANPSVDWGVPLPVYFHLRKSGPSFVYQLIYYWDGSLQSSPKSLPVTRVDSPPSVCFFIAPKALFLWLPNTHEVSEKRCPLADARYAVLGSGRGMCRQIRYHRKFLGGGSTLKGIQKNFMSVRPPGVGQPGPFPCGETAKWTILRPSGNQWSARSTALRSIRGVQWEYPSWSGVSQDGQSCPNPNFEIVNHDPEISLYGFSFD